MLGGMGGVFRVSLCDGSDVGTAVEGGCVGLVTTELNGWENNEWFYILSLRDYYLVVVYMCWHHR